MVMDVLVFSTMQLLSWENTKHDEIIIHYWDCLIQAFMIIFKKNLLTPDSYACKDLRIITDFCPTSSLVIFLFNVSSPSPFFPPLTSSLATHLCYLLVSSFFLLTSPAFNFQISLTFLLPFPPLISLLHFPCLSSSFHPPPPLSLVC